MLEVLRYYINTANNESRRSNEYEMDQPPPYNEINLVIDSSVLRAQRSHYLHRFRNLEEPLEHYDMPELPHKRKITDKYCILIFGLVLLTWCLFLLYALRYSDISRITNGVDNCGNICGIKNEQVPNISCSGVDELNDKLLTMRIEDSELKPDKCVKNCPNDTISIFNRCILKDTENRDIYQDFYIYLNKLKHDINNSFKFIICICFFGIVMNMAVFLMFQFCIAFIVCACLNGASIGMAALTTTFWTYAIKDQNDNLIHDWICAQNGNKCYIIHCLLCVVLIGVSVCMYFLVLKRKPFIHLFKQAINILASVPLILFEPILPFCILCMLCLLFLYLMVHLNNSGILTEKSEDFYDYSPNFLINFTYYFTILMIIWLSQFIVDCQYMVVSGAVTALYFARNKKTLKSPIYNSFYNLIRYHLGTVAFGSIILYLVIIVKILSKILNIFVRMAKCKSANCYLFMKKVFACVSKKAYVQTAMHGQPFYKSGKRAVELIFADRLTASDINLFGNFIIFMVQVWVIIVTVLLGHLLKDDKIDNIWPLITIATIIPTLLANSLFTIYKTAVDTIFLCYYEDCGLSDDETLPYYMTANLKKDIQDIKKKTGICSCNV